MDNTYSNIAGLEYPFLNTASVSWILQSLQFRNLI